MVTINWCLKQKKGIELVEPNENLSKAYFREAKETLQLINDDGHTKWDVIMAYYACYNSLYAILMKAGIKCEIHDCTIKLMKFIGFNKKDYLFLSELKDKRIGAQYYLKKERLDDLNEVKNFVMKCDQICEGIDVGLLRGKINDKKN